MNDLLPLKLFNYGNNISIIEAWLRTASADRRGSEPF